MCSVVAKTTGCLAVQTTGRDGAVAMRKRSRGINDNLMPLIAITFDVALLSLTIQGELLQVYVKRLRL